MSRGAIEPFHRKEILVVLERHVFTWILCISGSASGAVPQLHPHGGAPRKVLVEQLSRIIGNAESNAASNSSNSTTNTNLPDQITLVNMCEKQAAHVAAKLEERAGRVMGPILMCRMINQLQIFSNCFSHSTICRYENIHRVLWFSPVPLQNTPTALIPILLDSYDTSG